jgi:SPP1 gp7 family putative phage head morphogenesis protein
MDYRRALDALIREMQAETVAMVRAVYEKNPPEIAQDKSPAVELNDAIKAMAAKWQARFTKIAAERAKRFAGAAMKHVDVGNKAAFRKSGMEVDFKMTASMNDAYQAVVAENVGLIRSIPSEYFTEIQGIAMRSVQRGRDLAIMTNELQSRYGVTRRRAALIARDQNNKATAVLNRVRQLDLGITEAIWQHSTAGREPRPEHVRANGRRFDIRKGCEIDGEFILPGEKINCRCYSISVIPGLD